jgi:hypothetical protein
MHSPVVLGLDVGGRTIADAAGEVATGRRLGSSTASGPVLGIATPRELLDLPGTTPLEKGLSG